MAEMPRPIVTKRQQYTDYALGILHETMWILGLTLAAFIAAVIAMAVFK
jgi:hypothetical protein